MDIDETACAEVMRRFQLPTKQDAINFALRSLAIEAASVREARGLKGIGWDCDLDEIRTDRAK